ncbi:RES family NAD+ phosphorylase [Novosphingobium sp. Leaf2]|uniref:RES family NAD+ phosphorylase n=1 Tax=Novosphingobium sp. Leaf2 TaxID=1735670 RepID=UPI0006F4321C|nr:RES family NAD+ phosphorylase [Novosphingobium sp. Leaf2]KQM20596.1 hypothetical protein ASE49_16495 [Novosphingobium sp. Leaf2]
MDVPLSHVRWTPCYRIVPSRFPPVSVFDQVADPADLDAVFALEAMTNDRLRQELGELSLVPLADRVSGPGTTAIMAAFTHLNPEGSRFSDGSFGVFYAAKTIDTAVAETCYHRERFMRATAEPAQELDMRVYTVVLDASLHDVRGLPDDAPVYAPDSYVASQAMSLTLRADNADGIVYRSVRHPAGECAAVFRPRLLSDCRQERHLCYVWDGTAIATVYEKRAFI